MPRRVFYLGAWIKHSGWYPDRKIRLYDRRACRWAGEFVHESLEVDGGVGAFKSDLLHFPYRDWNDHAARIARYSELAARAARSRGRREGADAVPAARCLLRAVFCSHCNNRTL